MIWDIVFWLAFAYLALAVVWHFFISAFRKPRRVPLQKDRGEQPEKKLGQSRVLPVVAIVAIAIAFVMKANPNLLFSGWSEAERAELEHFEEALRFYEQATNMMTFSPTVGPNEWETISALLQASLTEGEQVSDQVLDQLHDDLRAQYRNHFLAGLSAGGFGLAQYNQWDPNKQDTPSNFGADSLELGHDLLGEWNVWYGDHQESILARIM